MSIAWAMSLMTRAYMLNQIRCRTSMNGELLQNYNEVQKFLELVQYLAQFMPDIMAYTTLLSGSAHNNRAFQWTPLLDKCFESIKALAARAPILKPVHFSSNEPVWVITDGSKTGVSMVYGLLLYLDYYPKNRPQIQLTSPGLITTLI